MECRYKVGDKVKVRKDLETNIDYYMQSGPETGECYYGCVREMVEVRGEILTISVVDNEGWGYSVKENGWNWTDEMLEPATDECYCESLL